MVYRLLRVIMRHALAVFFRSLEIEGRESVPTKGPLLLAANHPNTLIDVLLVATCLDRKVGFIGKATLFENPLANFVFRFLGAVPVHRRQDEPAEGVSSNENVLADCEDAVARGEAILIFPEGISQDAPRLMKLKTGLARIAVGAEAKAPGQVSIVPAALVYDDYDTFRSRARITFAAPIRVAPYVELGERAGDPFVGVRALTGAVRQALEPEVVHVEQTEHDALLEDIDLLYGKTISAEAGGRLAARAALSNAINAFAEGDPERVDRFHAQVGEYRAALEAAGVDDAVVRGSTRQPSLGATVAFLLGAPFALWGALNHFVLYQLPRLAIRLLPKEPLYDSTVKLLMGLLGIIATYTIQGWGSYELAQMQGVEPPWLVTLIYLGTLPLCGLSALVWGEAFYARRRAAAARARRRSLSPEALADLSARRAALIAELDDARAAYQGAHAAPVDRDEPW